MKLVRRVCAKAQRQCAVDTAVLAHGMRVSMNDKYKRAFIANWTGIPFKNKEELMSIIINNNPCQHGQHEEALEEIIDKLMIDSFCNGDISYEFFNAYISDSFKDRLNNLKIIF